MTDADHNYLSDGTSIARLPKVSLHDHLDGGVRAETIVELAREHAINTPAEGAGELRSWIEEKTHTGSLEEYLEAFSLTTSLMQQASALTRVASECVQDLAAEGVLYGEVRWAPELHVEGGLKMEHAIVAVQEGIVEGMSLAASRGQDIRVHQILSAMRHRSKTLEVAKLAVKYRENGVVGFDIAGPEKGFPVSDHKHVFDYLAEEFFPVTVHAGEADGLESVRGALLDARALRLGHGVRLAEDIIVESQDDTNSFVTLGNVAKWVKDREIALEVSPCSNRQTGAFAQWGTQMVEHPFDLLYQLGFRVTVNTDNRLMSNTTLTKELGVLAHTFGYDALDLEIFQLNAAAAAFLPSEEREELAQRIVQGFGSNE